MTLLRTIRFALILLPISLGACQGPESFMQRGNMAYLDGNSKVATQFYTQALEHGKTRSAASLNLARISLEAGQFQETLNFLDGARDLELVHPQVMLYRAQAELGLGQNEAAQTELLRCTKTHPNYLEAQLELAKFLASSGGFEQALKRVSAAKADPLLLEQASLLNAEILRKSKDMPAAIAELETLISAQPLRLQTRYTLAEYLAESGNLSAAEKTYRDALSLDPKNLAGVFALAQILELQSKNDEALKIYEAIAGMAGRDATLAARAAERVRHLKPGTS